jgi:phenol 2-monooxygenase
MIQSVPSERSADKTQACHTHSPKAGQGMNVSMMDSYNLSWKLVHSLHGLTPKQNGNSADAVVRTFDSERVTVAKQLIEFDSKFSSMFSGQIGAADIKTSNLTHDMFLKVFSDGSGFTSGCGIEYADSIVVHGQQHDASNNPVIGTNYLQGTLKAGRRLQNVQVKRFADSNPRHLQDGKPAPLSSL